jgi:hypothetical protein
MTAGSLRRVAALKWRDVEAGGETDGVPGFEWVAPSDLMINESYQRNLGENSVALIRRIVARWSWHKFKPPSVARTEAGIEVIDGQHTAIAAASHPGIARIPVMVVAIGDAASRADAFLGHNRDRVGITPMQMHFAALVAAEPIAVEVAALCAAAGIRILKSPPAHGVYQPRDTVAVQGLRALVGRRHKAAARVLGVLAAAACAPVSAAGLRAAEMLLFDPEYAGEVEPDRLAATIAGLAAKAEAEAKLFAAAHKVPIWRALGIQWFLDLVRPARGKVALLQRHEWDAPASNRPLFEPPFAAKLILHKRPRWSTEDKASPRFPYAWYLWDYQHESEPVIRWLADPDKPAPTGRLL